jgi:hypothetical protein
LILLTGSSFTTRICSYSSESLFSDSDSDSYLFSASDSSLFLNFKKHLNQSMNESKLDINNEYGFTNKILNMISIRNKFPVDKIQIIFSAIIHNSPKLLKLVKRKRPPPV